MKKITLIITSSIVFISCAKNTKDTKKEEKNKTNQKSETLVMIKLYKKIDDKLFYWETWDKNSKTGIVHWGEVGTQGQDKDVESTFLNNYAKKIRNEMSEKLMKVTLNLMKMIMFI